ncbi:MAG: uncharacterized protein QOF51_1524 [Chloroflexota bacterium]|jgi:predicted RNA-binding protein YlxR (DUF448 family)|nr:uncharacterized protein [Chloroflexota bacterium]
MVRVVRAADGSVSVDPTSKKAGRGTYVCPQQACWQQALRAGALARVLKAEISSADRIALEAYAAALPLEPIPTTA